MKKITFDSTYIYLQVDGKDLKISLDKVSPSGYGIHWTLIDEDLSVEALLKLC